MTPYDDDDEDPDDVAYDDDEETLTVPCASCGTDVYEDALQCPVCGEYVRATGSAFTGRSLLFILLAAAGTAAVIWMLITRRA